MVIFQYFHTFSHHVAEEEAWVTSPVASTARSISDLKRGLKSSCFPTISTV